MTAISPITSPFQTGDQVVLAEGTYQGTTGVLVRFRPDANWADIAEPNGKVRCHPVAGLPIVGRTTMPGSRNREPG